MFCPKCGSQLKDGVKFCNKCGAAIPNRRSAPAGQGAQPRPQPQQAQRQYAPPQNQQRQNADYQPPRQEYNHYPAPTESAVKKSGVGKIVASSILAFFMFCMLLASIGMGMVFANFNGKAVAKIVKDMDFDSIKINDDGEEKSITDFIYDGLPDDMRVESEAAVTREELSEILDDSDVKSDIADLAARYVDYLIGETDSTFSADDVADVLFANADLIYEKSGYKMKPEDREDIRKTLESEDFKFATTEGLEKYSDFSDMPVKIKTLMLLSLIILIALTLVLAGIIALINRRHMRYTGLYYGIPLAVIGFEYLVSILAVSGTGVFAELLKPFFVLWIVLGAVSLLAGAGLIVMFALLKHKYKKTAAPSRVKN